MDYKLHPQAIEAEESVLASCMLGDYQDAIDILLPDDFYRTAHRKIFAAIAHLAKDEKPDLVTVVSRLRDTGELDECGGAAYLSKLIDTSYPGKTESHAKLIKEKSVLRDIITKANDASNLAYDAESAETVLDTVQSSFLKIDFAKTQTCSRVSDVIMGCIDLIETRSKAPNKVIGIPTGFGKLDMMTAGLQPGDLNILAARPSMGKTAIAMQIAQSACEHGYPTAVFSLEMSKESLGIRQISQTSRVDHSRVRIGYLNSEDWSRLTDAAGKISDLPLVIDDSGNMNVMEMRRRLRQYVKQHKIKLAVVDYLQLMQTNDPNYRKDLGIGEITRGLKLAAKEFDLSMLVLSQLNRKVEERSDKRPMLSDLRESGAIEQDADTVMFLYRDEVYNKAEDNPKRGMAELIVAKQRNGPTGTVPLTFLKHYMRFDTPYN